MSLFSKIVTKVFGKKSDKDLKAVAPIVEQINKEYVNLEQLSDSQLKEKFNNIKLELSDLIASNKEKLKRMIKAGNMTCEVFLLFFSIAALLPTIVRPS